MKLTAVAVDDEPMALSILKEYISKTPFIELKGLYHDSIEALTYVQENPVDLIFLDINMPDLTGLQFLNALEKKPLVIFTTAYSEYAVKSYEYRAIDYLLKPIEFERFFKAALRAKEEIEQKQKSKTHTPIIENNIQASDHIFVKSGTELHKIFINDILFIEGTGNYISVICKDKRTMTLINMSNILKLLPEKQFVRVHKSYIVSINYIEKIERHQLTIKGKAIPIGITFRENFFKQIEKK